MTSLKNTFFFSPLIVALLFGASEKSFAKRGKGSKQDFRALYIVPVSQPDLLKYALFSDVEVKYEVLEEQKIKIEYSLPLELTGIENEMKFAGTKSEDGSVTLKGYEGYDGSAQCTAAVILGRCEMTYNNIEFDAKIRKQILTTMTNGNEVELEKRLQVANEFQALVTDQEFFKKIIPQELNQSPNDRWLPSFTRGDSEIHGILEIIQ